MNIQGPQTCATIYLFFSRGYLHIDCIYFKQIPDIGNLFLTKYICCYLTVWPVGLLIMSTSGNLMQISLGQCLNGESGVRSTASSSSLSFLSFPSIHVRPSTFPPCVWISQRTAFLARGTISLQIWLVVCFLLLRGEEGWEKLQLAGSGVGPSWDLFPPLPGPSLPHTMASFRHAQLYHGPNKLIHPMLWGMWARGFKERGQLVLHVWHRGKRLFRVIKNPWKIRPDFLWRLEGFHTMSYPIKYLIDMSVLHSLK